MIPERLLLTTAVVKRDSIVISSGPAPILLTLNSTYTTPVKILVESSGVTSNLSVDIVGSSNETMIITPASSGFLRSSNTFSGITSIDITGGGTGIFSIKAVSAGGNVPVPTETTIGTIKGRFEISRRVIPQLDVETQGVIHVERYSFYTNSTLQINDKLVINNIEYLVESIPLYEDGVGYHHTEARIKLLK